MNQRLSDEQKRMAAPCGLYCGVCGVRMAHAAGDIKLKEKLAPAYGVKPEEVKCGGCLSDELFAYCVVCPIRECAKRRDIEGCHVCEDFPCEHIDGFPVPIGKRIILGSVPARRDLGTLKWIELEERHYRCPKCDAHLFRGARKCRACGEAVSIE